MSTQLGNYIHYRYSNYLKYGTQQKGSGSPMSGAQLLLQMRMEAKRSVRDVSEIRLRKYEADLNYIYGTPKSNGTAGLTAADRQALADSVTQFLKNAGYSMANVEIDSTNFRARHKSGQNTLSQTRMGSIGRNNFTTVNAVASRIDELKSRMAQFNRASAHTDFANDIQNFLNRYNGLVQEVTQLQNSIASQNSSGLPATAVKQAPPPRRYAINELNRSFIDDLNTLIRVTGIASMQLISGAAAEYIAAALPYVYERSVHTGVSTIMKEFEQQIASHIVGQDRSQKVLDSKSVWGASDIESPGHSSTFQKLGRNSSGVYVRTTQNKVDVRMVFPGQHGTFVNASVKNYSQYARSIHLLTGTSLIKYLQLYPYLGNHYLNITANIGREDRAPYVDIQNAHAAMLVALGTHALAGGLLGKRSAAAPIEKLDSADVLVINRRGRNVGQFKVYSVARLLNNIEKFLEVGNLPMEWKNERIIDSSLPDYKLGYARCIEILKQLHQQKLDVSLNTAALT